MNKLRILVWCPLVSAGGGVRLLARLLSALAVRQDIEAISLVTPQGGITRNQIDPEAWPKIKWCEFDAAPPPERLATRMKRRLLRCPSRLPGHEELLTQSRENDLLYAFWPHRSDFPTVDLPVVCTFQDATFFDFPEILGGKETLKEWHRAQQWFQGCAQVVVSSEATRTALTRHFDLPRERTEVIHHAILPADSRATTQADSPPSPALPEKYIIFPSNTTTHKNHYNLLIAWSRFQMRDQYPLLLVGYLTQLLNCKPREWPAMKGETPRLIGVIQRHGLQANKDYFALGYVPDDDIPNLVRRATALIMPTLSEGGGSFPIEEALSLGTPVLCSDIPVLREHLAGRTARIGWFDPDSPESIQAALTDLFAHYDDYKQSALAGMNDPRPSWHDVADQYAATFRRAVEAYKNARM
ncbi:MAG: glycosyltransferase family 1 protein [bacterium]